MDKPNLKQALWSNIQNLMKKLYGKENLTRLIKEVVDVNYLDRSATTILAGGSGE